MRLDPITEHLPPLHCVRFFHPGSLDRGYKHLFSLNAKNPRGLASAARVQDSAHTWGRALSAAQLELSAVVFQRGRLGPLLLFQFPYREQRKENELRIITAVTDADTNTDRWFIFTPPPQSDIKPPHSKLYTLLKTVQERLLPPPPHCSLNPKHQAPSL